MLMVRKPGQSLVDLKKQQWAREREEMSHLYLPWGTRERNNNNGLQIRNQFASTLELHKHSSYEYQEPVQRQRSPSLPPIKQLEQEKSRDERRCSRELLNRNLPSAKRFAFYDEDAEGDTSGYGSETLNNLNVRKSSLHDTTNARDFTSVVAWHQDPKDNRYSKNVEKSSSDAGAWSARSGRSTTDEARARWGDRGVATGRLWEPTNPNARLPQMPITKKGTPSWVERGLNMTESEVLVIDQRSSTNSGLECDRSSCNGSDEGRTFLRGQNIPLEPEIKAQRENKRLKALEIQSAILNQLEDREKRRQEEKERRLKEERLEELRIRKEQEEDRLRLEVERKKNEEKRLQERRNFEALKKALEEAERLARQEKEKRFHFQKQMKEHIKYDETSSTINDCSKTDATPQTLISPTVKPDRTYDVNSTNSQQTEKTESHSHHTTEVNSPRAIDSRNLNLFIRNVPPLALTENNQFNIIPLGINSASQLINNQSSNIQLAVLVPQNMTNNLYNVALNSVISGNESTDIEKILTPTKYRLSKSKDAATQTELCNEKDFDCQASERNILEKTDPNIDENAPHDNRHSMMKKDRRFRSEERYNKEIDNRPKWGVNRPAAQYKKQSEKDPFYSQKRKVRQKNRQQIRQYLSQSSDDSRSPSPLNRSEKTSETYIKRNSHSQSYWRTKRRSQDISKNNPSVNVYTDAREINGDHINTTEIENKKSPKTSPTKRMTLSQKFINDKYGNRKLWTEDIHERNIKSNMNDTQNRKKITEQFKTVKKNYLDGDDGSEEHENYILNA